MALHLGNGKKLTELPLGGPATGDTVSQTITRSDLYLVLRDEAVRQGITVEYNKRLVRAENTGEGVRAEFADGNTAEGDLLIGADGLRSQVRRIIDPDAPAARYLPLLNTGGFAEGIRIDSEPGVMNMVFGKQSFFCYFYHQNSQVGWFANLPRKVEPTSAELAATSEEQWRAELARLFQPDQTPAVDIIKATPELYRPGVTYDLPKVRTWHRGQMIIIGDAAHAVSPASGQGASMAIEDALTLGRCLRDVHLAGVRRVRNAAAQGGASHGGARKNDRWQQGGRAGRAGHPGFHPQPRVEQAGQERPDRMDVEPPIL
jgi:2-polyprenyl-6-methoxyphenol hydroxylase-like FAD-dependent oxidoreductase